MKKISLFLLLATLGIAFAAPLSSVYTPLEFGKCKAVSRFQDEAGGAVDLCPGVAGYTLQLEEGDLRQNVQVISPKGKKYSLDLWYLVSSGFSSTGPRAEWRWRVKFPKRSSCASTPVKTQRTRIKLLLTSQWLKSARAERVWWLEYVPAQT